MLGILEPHSLEIEIVPDPFGTRPPDTIPYTGCGRSRSYGMHRGPKIWGTLGPPLGMGALLTRRNTPLAHMCYLAICGRSNSNSTSVYNYGDLPQKFYPSRPAFQSHSRSLGQTSIDRLPMTSY